jgi:DNA-binding NarL/FixJ family response regulator
MMGLVGITADQPAVIRSTTAALRVHRDWCVAAVEDTVDAMLDNHAQIDLVILDLLLSDGSTPAENIKRFTARNLPTLVYASGERLDLLWEASRAGAAGMLDGTALARSLSEALRGRTDTAGGAIEEPIARVASVTTRHTDAQLSERQVEILALYASGATAQNVADALFISKNTVIDHIQRIRTKYAAVARPAETKVALYRRAVEDGLISARLSAEGQDHSTHGGIGA